MAEEKKIVSWSDLDAIEDQFTKTIPLPNVSQAIGQEVFCKVRAIDAIEIVKAFNFPMDEINQMVAEKAEGTAFVTAVQEHASGLEVEEMFETIERVVKLGLVEPDPSAGNLKRLTPDYETIFGEIVALTVPKEATEDAAQFRPDGE